MNLQKIIFVVVGIVLVAGIIFVLVFGLRFSTTMSEKTLDLPGRNDTVPGVPILYDFGTKIVYTTDTTVSKDLYIGDCTTRGGIFNVCGKTCAPNAQTCGAVCAFTCTVK